MKAKDIKKICPECGGLENDGHFKYCHYCNYTFDKKIKLTSNFTIYVYGKGYLRK